MAAGAVDARAEEKGSRAMEKDDGSGVWMKEQKSKAMGKWTVERTEGLIRSVPRLPVSLQYQK